MSERLPTQLIAQARHLAAMDKTRPSQANLRRAVSALYYGLFHHLIAQSSGLLIGTTAERRDLRQITSRAFQHRTMLEASVAFSGGTMPQSFQGFKSVGPVPTEIKRLANLFGRCQSQRHTADYDLSARFERAEVIKLVDEVEQAIAAFRPVRRGPMARLYLVSLLLWDRMRRA